MKKAIAIGVFIAIIAGLVGGTLAVLPKIVLPDGTTDSDSTGGTPDGRPDGTAEEMGVQVRLLSGEHYTVISENPVRIAKGADARFEVLFEENYTFDKESSPGEYRGGTVILPEVMTDTDFNITAKVSHAYFDFAFTEAEAGDGEIFATEMNGRYPENTEITLRAVPEGDKVFLGWSVDGNVINGGTMVSYSSSYTFRLTENTRLYPNFLTAGHAIILYDLNGGHLAEDPTLSTVITQFDTTVRICPNLQPDTGMFVREGYTLLEYTENQDGTGTAVNPGGITALPEDGILRVYAQWAKWSPAYHFRYEETDGGITIVEYLEDESRVVIPAEIDGKKVTRIASGAFRNRSFDTLVLPPSIIGAAGGAFSNCQNFDTLYICDTFTEIEEDAFLNCKKFSHLRLNAAQMPHYPVNAESITTRWEYILTRDTSKPLLLLVGGSSSLYGFNGPTIEKGLDYKYTVINAGTNAGGTGMLYIEGLSHFMQAGDIVVNAPEFGANQMGGYQIVWRTFRATEMCYNLYRYVDFSKFYDFFHAMSEFNYSKEARAGNSPSTYMRKNTSLTPGYCDLAGNHPYENKTFGPINVKAGSLSDTAAAHINTLIDILAEQGITYYLSSAPVYIYKSNSTEADYQAYYERAISLIHAPVISHPADYTFDPECYCNSSYHLTTEYSIVRSERLLADLLRQFAAEKAVGG